MNAILQQSWRLEGVLGAGGLATVYRAVAPDGSIVAAKVLHASRATTLANEARIAMALVGKLLAKSPFDRFQTAEAVALALRMPESSPSRPSETRLAVLSSACAGCGAPIPSSLGCCLRCGTARPFIADGRSRVLVVARTAEERQLSPDERHRVLEWLAAHPELRLAPGRLQAERPGLPLVLCKGLSEQSAESIVRSLTAAGVNASAQHGSALRDATLRAAMVRAPLRSSGTEPLLIGFGVSLLLGFRPETLMLWAAIWLTFSVVTMLRSLRPAIKHSATMPVLGNTKGELAIAVAALPATAASLHHERNKDMLASIAGQVVALRAVFEDSDALELEDELRRALEVAMVATARLDVLDHQIESLTADAAPDAAGVARHERLAERDRWSTRLNQLSATLESLRIRALSAAAKQRLSGDDEEVFEALRFRVEALEELQVK